MPDAAICLILTTLTQGPFEATDTRRMPRSNHVAGKVFLVGAGPGDPGLITARGIECLAQADLVFYDYLVNPLLLEHLRPGAEAVCLGRHGGGRILKQDEVNQRIVEAARAGKTVVRLKSGDPMVFGRAVEELTVLVEAGIDFEIVPGITAAAAVSAYAGIPVTNRDLASAVALVTGQEDDAKAESSLDYAALAKFPGTLVVYMGVTTAERWAGSLIDNGLAADTPAAIVRRCAWPDQQIIRCPLGEVAARLAGSHMRPPVIVLIGEAVQDSARFDWFTRRPLYGTKILIARAVQQAGSLRRQLEQLGAETLVQPAIEIRPPGDWSAVDAAIARLADFDWLVFSSANGVRFFLDRLLAGAGDLRQLGGVKLAAIGPGTAAELARYHLRADLQPPEFRAESLAAELAPAACGKRLLLLRASRGREALAESLLASGALVEQVVVYDSVDITAADPRVAALLERGEVDYVVVTSSAIARSLANLFGEHLRQPRLASISPVTTATLAELGYQPAVEARTYTMDGIVAAILADASEARRGA